MRRRRNPPRRPRRRATAAILAPAAVAALLAAGDPAAAFAEPARPSTAQRAAPPPGLQLTAEAEHPDPERRVRLASALPEVLSAMKEVAIDLSTIQPTLLTTELAARSDLLITMGCGEKCPVVPGLRRDDWPLEDPKGKSMEIVRRIRDDVRARVADLIAREGWGEARAAGGST